MKILLVVYDNDAFLHIFPLGLGYVASSLKNAGHEIFVYQQDVLHSPEEHLTAHLDKNKYDAVCVGVIGGYYQYRKLLKISEAINNSRNRPFYFIGGHGPSPEPFYFLKKTKADVVVVGEGERTAVELCGAIENGVSLAKVKGIAFLDKINNKFTLTEDRSLIQGLDSIPFPAWDYFNIDYYALYRFPNIKHNQRGFPVITGRGCSFSCNFCYRMDKGLRQRSVESVIDEVRFLNKRYDITYFNFADELFMSSEARTAGLCEAFLENSLDINWYCNGRLNYASKNMLKLMKKAGCVFINYGIEAMDDEVLKNMNKMLTVEQVIAGIENTLAVGISPGFNIIFGNIGDTRETLKKGVEFLLKYDDAAQMRTIRPVTPYPGSPLYYYAMKEGLLKDISDFYERKHVNSDLLSVNFTGMSDDEFHQCLLEANKALVHNYFNKKTLETTEQARRLYMERDAAFRGFR